MAMNGYVDGELDMMMCEGLFDNIEDLLDFSTDDEGLGMMDSAAVVADGAGGSHGYQQIVSPSAAETPVPLSNGEGGQVTAASEANKICDDINIIGEDWISKFLDDSNFDVDFPAATATIAAAPKEEEESLFQSFSPVSVLEEPNFNVSSSSISDEKTIVGSSSSSSSSSSMSWSDSTNSSNGTVFLATVGPTKPLVPGRARSKRPRRAVPAHVTVPIIPPASEGPPAIPTLLPECESYGESCCPVSMMRKKKKNRLAAVVGNAGSNEEGIVGVRKCQHCGIQKTPQWRAGPTGPKTLCNACGVRYKSGRLFPEYRPAASPTFMPSLHSNSHKKVVEMRNKVASGMPLPEYPAAKNCDLLAYIRRRE